MKITEAQQQLIFNKGATPHTELKDFKPQKITKAYKQFKLKIDPKTGENLAPGLVFPLYVNTAGSGTSGGLEVGKWYKAGEGESWYNPKNGKLYTKGKGYGLKDGNQIEWQSYRPGWHTTNTPWGNQRGDGKVIGGIKGTNNNYRNTRFNEVWAELELCLDVNLQDKANSMGKKTVDKCLDHLDDGGYYTYQTNTNASKDQQWYIVDKIRIVRILDDDTVDDINSKFYNDLSKKTGRKINNDPLSYTSKTSDIPYWKMPRINGKRYTRQDLINNGYVDAERTKDAEYVSENKKRIRLTESELYNIISECVYDFLRETRIKL